MIFGTLYIILFFGHQSSSEAETEVKPAEVESDEEMSDAEENVKSVAGGKKDPILRRRELLVDSGLAEVCLFCCSCVDIRGVTVK